MIPNAIYECSFTGGTRMFKTVKLRHIHLPGDILPLFGTLNIKVEEWEVEPIGSHYANKIFYYTVDNPRLKFVRMAIANIPKEAV